MGVRSPEGSIVRVGEGRQRIRQLLQRHCKVRGVRGTIEIETDLTFSLRPVAKCFHLCEISIGDEGGAKKAVTSDRIAIVREKGCIVPHKDGECLRICQRQGVSANSGGTASGGARSPLESHRRTIPSDRHRFIGELSRCNQRSASQYDKRLHRVALESLNVSISPVCSSRAFHHWPGYSSSACPQSPRSAGARSRLAGQLSS